MKSPRRSLNPFLLRRAKRSGKTYVALSAESGFTHPQALYTVLHADRLPATPLLVERLVRLADAIGFPRDEIFLDGEPSSAEAQR